MEEKTLDFGEYIVKIQYDKETESIDIELFDQLGGLIESISVSE